MARENQEQQRTGEEWEYRLGGLGDPVMKQKARGGKATNLREFLHSWGTTRRLNSILL